MSEALSPKVSRFRHKQTKRVSTVKGQ